MTNKVKFTQVSRVICPKTNIHYLDAISEDGIHYTAEQQVGIEKWIVFTQMWKKDPQQPIE